MEPGIVVVAALACFAVGLGVGLYAARHAAATQSRTLELLLQQERENGARLGVELRSTAEALATARAERDAERRAAAERADEAERSREQVRAEIEKLAGRLVDDKGQALLRQSRDSLEALLAPVRERLKEFEAKVESAYVQDSRDRASLIDSLRKLEVTQARLHEDAESLTRALTADSKAQGDWGELVLERVLETAGLTEGREYDLQVDHVGDDGAHRRPDALVYLPGNRAIVVDAKCSLTAFVEANRAIDEAARGAALQAHVASLRTHVKELAGKSYQSVLRHRTLDVVLLFVPSEAAFQAALARDVALAEEALRQGVVLVSPTTLLATLRVVHHVWLAERQNVNAQRIAQEAGKLLDKLGAFLGDLEAVGVRLDQAHESFANAWSKLSAGRGNVLKKARDLVALGAQVKADRARSFATDADDDEVEPPEATAEIAAANVPVAVKS